MAGSYAVVYQDHEFVVQIGGFVVAHEKLVPAFKFFLDLLRFLFYVFLRNRQVFVSFHAIHAYSPNSEFRIGWVADLFGKDNFNRQTQFFGNVGTYWYTSA